LPLIYQSFVVEHWNQPVAFLEKRIGTHHYSVPDLYQLDWHQIEDPSAHNFVVAEKGADWQKDRQLIFGQTARNCVLIFGRDAMLRAGFHFTEADS